MHKSESKDKMKYEISIYYSYIRSNIALFLTKCCFPFTYIHGLFHSGPYDATSFFNMVTYNLWDKLKSLLRRFTVTTMT